ncbi:MAG: hypothetical protein P8J87_10905 [Verrucomicrobiales bacterium]|nr:hypothetical protein [Verrucomicrobiales bacterium]
MTSRRSNTLILCLAILAATLSPPVALSEDTVITKSGRTYVGEIVEKNSQVVKIRYRVSQGIIDIATIQRSDVDEIQSESPDLVAYNTLKNTLPTADMLATADYQKLIDGAPAKFLRDFPTSPYNPEVQKIVATLKTELGRASAGDQKVDGEWLTPEELKTNKFNIDALILLGEMKSLASSGDTLQSLKTFAQIETDYPIAKAYTRAIPTAIEAATQHKTVLADLLIRLPERQAKRADTSSLEPAAAARTKNAIRMEDAKWAKIRSDEGRAKTKWRSVYAYSKDDITKAIKATDKELTRLRRIDTKRTARVADAAAAGFIAFAAQDYKKAISNFAAASSAGGRHPLVSEMRARSEELYQQRLKETEAEREAAALTAKLNAKQGSTIAPKSAPPKNGKTTPESKPAPERENKPVAVATSEKRPTASGGPKLQTILIALLVLVFIGMIVGNIIARKKSVPDEDN